MADADGGLEASAREETDNAPGSLEETQSKAEQPPAECAEKQAAAEAALDAGNFVAALDNFQSALAVLECEPRLPQGLHALHLQLLDGISACHQGSGRLDEALEAMASTLVQACTYKRPLDEAMACLAVAEVFASKGDEKKNCVLLLKLSDNVGSKMIEGGVGGSTIPTLNYILKKIDREKLDLEDAPPALGEFLRSEQAQEWDRVTGEKCFGSNLHLLESIQWFEHMASLAREISNVRAQALGSLGTIYVQLEQYGIAKLLFQDVILYGQSTNDQQAIGNAASSLGKVFDMLAKKDVKKNWVYASSLQLKAIEMHKIARTAYQALGQQEEVSKSWSRVAKGYSVLRQHQQAITNLRYAQQAAQQAKNLAVEADVIRKIGLQYQLLAQHRSALEMHETDYKIQQQLRSSTGVGRASRNLSISKCALGSHKQALKLATFALEVAEKEADSEAQALALIQLVFFLCSPLFCFEPSCESRRALPYVFERSFDLKHAGDVLCKQCCLTTTPLSGSPSLHAGSRDCTTFRKNRRMAIDC